MLSRRFSDAVQLAIEAHHGQVRKGTTIPYIAHPLAVASLVLEYGGSEDQAIAAVLHDAIEDGGEAYAPRIEATFGAEVLALVQASSDGTAEGKAKARTPAAKRTDWRRRKEAYLQRLETDAPTALLVTACDKLHNARAIVADLEVVGPAVFNRFSAGRDGTLWYYAQAELVLRRRKCPVVDALGEALIRMRQLARSWDEIDVVTEFAAALEPRQRERLRTVLGGLESAAQQVLHEGSRALGTASSLQQRLMAACQNIDSAQSAP